MQQAKSLARILTIVVCLGVGLVWLTTADSAATKHYEVDATAAVESYYGNNDRMVAAYEQLASQYLNLVQNQLNRTSDDIQRGGQKLEAIEKKLDAMAIRLGRIEKALKIQPESEAAAVPLPNKPGADVAPSKPIQTP
jgi:Skp family chaperone for outer membrane proteins